MYLIAFAFAFIVLAAVVMAYPFKHNPSRVIDEGANHVDGKIKPEEVSLPPARKAFPSPVPTIDITQPLLHPVVPTETITRRPPIPHGTTNPVEIMTHPSLLVNDPKRSQLFASIPQGPGDVHGTPFGDVVVTVKLPTTVNLCKQLGISKPPMFRLRGNAFLHGNHVAHPAIDPEGNVIPHVFITSWNKYTGEVT